MKFSAFSLRFVMGIALLTITSCGSSPATKSKSDIYKQMLLGQQEEANIYSHYLSARYAGLIRDGENAASYYSDVLALTPDDVHMRERAVIYALVAGDVETAINLAETMPKAQAIASGMPQLILGVDDFSNGEWKKARLFEPSNTSFMQNAIGQEIRAWAALAMGRVDEALIFEDALHETATMRSMRLFAFGLKQLAAYEDEAALLSFEQAWALGGRFPQGVDAYVRLLVGQGQADKARVIVDQYFADIGDNPLIDTLDTALRDNTYLHIPRMTAREGAGASILGYALAADSGRQSGDVISLYLSIVLMIDKTQEAARILLSDTLRRNGRLIEAYQQLEKITDESVYFGASKARQAWLLYDLGELDAALELARTSLQLNPGRSLQMQLADLYRALERYEEAEKLFHDVATSDLEQGYADWRVLFARASMRDKLGRWDEAQKDLLLALHFAPDRPEVLNYLGYSWVDRGVHIDQGFEMIMRAMNQKPDEGYIRDSLGWAYYRLQRYDEAVKHLEEAAELSPTDPVINDHLGDAYWRIGQTVQAQYQWSRVIEYAEDDAMIEDVLQKLETGLDTRGTTILTYKQIGE